MRTARIVVVALLTSCTATQESAYEFALVGDSPYGAASVPSFEALVQDVNAHPALRWVIHVGDVKAGGEPCTDELLRSRFDLYQTFRPAFVFTPGDNDWFDCTGAADTVGYDYDRLAHLRGLFYPHASRTTGGRPLSVRTQASEPGFGEFVENVLWEEGRVVYATVHLIALTRPPTDSMTAERRMDAALAWIETAFDVAEERGSTAVFLASQADPWIVSGLPPLVGSMCEACVGPRTGLERLYPVLVREVDAFGRPVVLAVGDTHVFRVDKPLYRDDGSLVENFTRVETFGSPYVHWVRVTVDPSDPQVFSFHQELVEPNVRDASGS